MLTRDLHSEDLALTVPLHQAFVRSVRLGLTPLMH